MARQGIVLKIEKQLMVVMTEEGEFLELPLPKTVPAPGAIINIPPSRLTYRLALVAVLLVIVLSLSIIRPFLMPQAVAAIAFDLPVGLELGVDAQNRVVKVEAQEPASQALVKALNLKGVDIYTAANRVVQATCREMNSGAGQGETAFMVTVMPLKGKGRMNLDRQRLHEHLLRELERQEFEGYLIVQESEGDPRGKAAQLELPVAKYLLWERYGGETAEFNSPEELKALSVENLISQDEEVLDHRFPGMWCRVGKKGGNASSVSHMQHRMGSGSPAANVLREEISEEENENIPAKDMSGPMRGRGSGGPMYRMPTN